MRRILAAATAAAVALTVPLISDATAAPSATGCDSRANNTYKKLLECVTLDGAREHQHVFQAIADANGDTRVSGTRGYDDSADYAADVFRDAGLEVTVQEFEFQTFITTGRPSSSASRQGRPSSSPAPS